jgi:hypothetical protein
MPSRNIGKKRQETDDTEVPAELIDRREAQDRPKAEHGGGARSPVDSMHVDEPKHQDNARGHRQRRES